jgi:hypothetical protein
MTTSTHNAATPARHHRHRFNPAGVEIKPARALDPNQVPTLLDVIDEALALAD